MAVRALELLGPGLYFRAGHELSLPCTMQLGVAVLPLGALGADWHLGFSCSFVLNCALSAFLLFPGTFSHHTNRKLNSSESSICKLSLMTISRQVLKLLVGQTDSLVFVKDTIPCNKPFNFLCILESGHAAWYTMSSIKIHLFQLEYVILTGQD